MFLTLKTCLFVEQNTTTVVITLYLFTLKKMYIYIYIYIYVFVHQTKHMVFFDVAFIYCFTEKNTTYITIHGDI